MQLPKPSILIKHLRNSRHLVLGALLLSFIGMILSFLALFAGNVAPNSQTAFMGYAPVIRYDTSTFSPTGAILSEGTQTSIHILSVCSGAAGQKATCISTRRGDPAGPPFETTGTVLLVGLSLQIAASGIALMLLPWLLRGTIHLNGILPPLLLVGWIGGFTAACAGSSYSLSQTHIPISHRVPTTYSPTWIALLWFAQACILTAAALEHVERNFERWTRKGSKIDRENLKSRGTRVWVWNPEIWWKRV